LPSPSCTLLPYTTLFRSQLALAQGGGTDEFPPVDVVLDVRTNNEWQKSHVAGAVHVPLYELKNRTAEIPAGTVWVHCGSGYRATAAASLLESAGRTAVIVNDLFGNAEPVGVSLTSAA